MRALRVALVLVGFALLAAMIAWNDPAAILASIRRLGWGLLLIIVFPATLVMVFDTLGWRFAFERDRVPFPLLVTVRAAGEAFNMATPTAALGGEAVKAWLLRGTVPLEESLPSVIVAKTTITIAQGLFLLIGVAMAWTSAMPDSTLLRAMQWLLVIEALGLAGFVVGQTGGLLARFERLIDRIGLHPGRGRGVLGRVDDVLARFYRERPGRLTLSIGFHLIAWLLGVIETYLILHLLEIPVSLTTATLIEAFGAAIKFATFLIPASLGALEGGYAATFAALGLAASTGVSFSLVRRVREAAWIAVGLLAFALMRPRTARAPARRGPAGWRP
ncbi:MAG: flippase-like domain-containing protein [Candidatus Rokubacteria bacterium]|nr:flippase-like domain-containing protein [Candidatus Rokubacteria bacterium]